MKKKSDQRFWPFRPQQSILFTLIFLIILVPLSGIFREDIGWGSDSSANVILIGVFIVGLLPVLLAAIDLIIERGGTIGYGELKIDFSKVSKSVDVSFKVPVNIGVRGNFVADSLTINILGALEEASSSSIIVIDLEDGNAWWETRLLVLLSGAERLNKPDKIVFVADNTKGEQYFLGWAGPKELMQLLLKKDLRYQQAFYAARAVAKQYESLSSFQPAGRYTPAWMQNVLNKNYSWMAFAPGTDLPNPFLTEQILQDQLGENIERPGGAIAINSKSLLQMFDPVLNKQVIDKSWTDEQQTSELFIGDAPFIAITEHENYLTLVSRQMLLSQVLKDIVAKKEG